MISYRKLAMRVLGHPLRVSTNTPRPASHRVTALALTAAMVAGMAAPAYAGTYYIGNGDITITKDESGTYVKQGNNSSNDGKGDLDNTDIVIKGGNRPEGTTGTGSEGGNSSEGGSSGTGTPTTSPVQSASATPQSEDNSDPKEMVYLDDKKADPNGSDSSDGGGEGNAPQTNDATGSESGGSGSGGSDTKGDDTSGSEGDTTGNEDNDPQPGGTPTTGNEENDPQPGDSSAPESQFMYTSAYNDEGTPNESTTTLKTAAENFTKNVIRIINKLAGNDNTLNVTLDNVNITAKNDAALSVEGAGNTKITLSGSNTLTSGGSHAGLEHNGKDYYDSDTGKLTITSGTNTDDGSNTGSLTATGGNGAAGIGSAWSSIGSSSGAGTIEITGGDITAIGGGSGNSSNNTTVTINGGTIVKAQGGQGHGSYDGGSGIHSDGDLTISGNAHIVNAIGGNSNSRDAGDGIRASTLTISGEAHIDNATGGTADSGSAGDGIYSYVTLTIKDNAQIGTAKGGDATARDKDGGCGIRNHGQFTMSGGTITNAVGGTSTGGDGGDGIYCGDTLTIAGGEIQKTTGGNADNGTGGYGIRGDTLTIAGGKIEQTTGGDATGNYGTGGSGIGSNRTLTIEGGEIQQTTGGTATGTFGTGGYGIRSNVALTIKGGKIEQTTGGDATGNYGTGGSGICSSFVNVAGGTINTTGGSGKSGGAGISGYGSSSNIRITGGTITATGTSDAPAIGNGIVSISNAAAPLDITATASDADNAIQSRDDKKLDEIIHLEEKGKSGLVKLVKSGTNSLSRLFHNGVYAASQPGFSGSENHPFSKWVTTKAPTCTEPGERQRSCTISGCVVTETEELPALGHKWSGWTPVEGGSREYRICEVCNEVEYRDVSHNSGISDSSSGDSTISTGLRVLDPAQADILQNIQLVRLNQIIDVLYIDVSHETASLQGVLSDLIGLRSENIETIVFSTERCTSTLSLSDVAALGAGDTPFTLSHSGSTATFTVDGADHSALLR